MGRNSDVTENEAEVGLPVSKKFVGRHQLINLIMMSVPHRDDFVMESCVNSEIKVFNRKLKKSDY